MNGGYGRHPGQPVTNGASKGRIIGHILAPLAGVPCPP